MREEIQQLKSQVERMSENPHKIELLTQLSHKLWQISEYEKSKRYASQALALSDKLDFVRGKSKSYNLFGLIESTLNNYDKALDYYVKALELNEETDDKSSIATTLNNIGQIYFSLNRYEDARDFFLRALEHRPDYHRPHNNLGIMYTKMQQYDKALEYLHKALEIAKTNHEQRSQAICLVNIGEIYQKLVNYEEALEYYRNALSITKNIGDKNVSSSILLGIGSVFLESGDYEKAIAHTEQAKEIAGEIKNRDVLKDCYHVLSRIYSELERYQQAFENLKKYSDLKDEIYTDEISKRISEIRAKYELEKKELEAMQMAEKASRLASIGVMAAGITHEINQPLNAIKVSAEGVLFWHKRNPNSLPEMFIEELKQISKAADRIDEIIQHMRTFWVSPESKKIIEVNLNEAVQNALSLVETQLNSHGIIKEESYADRRLMIKANQVHIEQIVINLVVNAMHSLDETSRKDKKIWINTRREDGEAILEISDNGVGIPENAGDTIYDPFYSTKQPGEGMGLGLAIVKRFIDKFNGSITVENNETGGACFTIKFPAIE